MVTPETWRPLPNLVFYTLFLILNSHANVELPLIFSSNMVLQREIEVPIWGTASPSENITVSFLNQEKSTIADNQGKYFP